MRAVLTRLDQSVELVAVLRQVVRLENNQFPSTWDHGGVAFKRLVGQFPKTSFGLA